MQDGGSGIGYGVHKIECIFRRNSIGKYRASTSWGKALEDGEDFGVLGKSSSWMNIYLANTLIWEWMVSDVHRVKYKFP